MKTGKILKRYRFLFDLDNDNHSYILNCGHRYCSKCLDDYENNGIKLEKNGDHSMISTFKCPFCRNEYGKHFKKYHKPTRKTRKKWIYHPQYQCNKLKTYLIIKIMEFIGIKLI